MPSSAEGAVLPSTLYPRGAVERQHGTPIATRVTFAWQRLVGAVLNAEHCRERHSEPLLGQAASQPEIVGWIGERDVVRVCVDTADKIQRVRPMNDGRITGTQCRRVRADGCEARRRKLDEVDALGAAGQCLEPQRPGTGE